MTQDSIVARKLKGATSLEGLHHGRISLGASWVVVVGSQDGLAETVDTAHDNRAQEIT